VVEDLLNLNISLAIVRGVGGSLDDIYRERVSLFLDCWEYRFGLRTLGGAYIRHLLLFTDSYLVDVETGEASEVPGRAHGGLGRWAAYRSSGGLLSYIATYIFWRIIEEGIKRAFKIRERSTAEEIREIRSMLGENASVGEFIEAAKNVLAKSGLKKVRIGSIYRYMDLENIRVDVDRHKSTITLRFTADGKKRKLIANCEPAELSELEQRIKSLLPVSLG
jgi:plasmid stability protein